MLFSRRDMYLETYRNNATEKQIFSR